MRSARERMEHPSERKLEEGRRCVQERLCFNLVNAHGSKTIEEEGACDQVALRSPGIDYVFDSRAAACRTQVVAAMM